LRHDSQQCFFFKWLLHAVVLFHVLFCSAIMKRLSAGTMSWLVCKAIAEPKFLRRPRFQIRQIPLMGNTLF
jgi:hypothetical protein